MHILCDIMNMLGGHRAALLFLHSRPPAVNFSLSLCLAPPQCSGGYYPPVILHRKMTSPEAIIPYFPTGNPEIVIQFPVAANSRRYISHRYISPANRIISGGLQLLQGHFGVVSVKLSTIGGQFMQDATSSAHFVQFLRPVFVEISRKLLAILTF